MYICYPGISQSSTRNVPVWSAQRAATSQRVRPRRPCVAYCTRALCRESIFFYGLRK